MSRNTSKQSASHLPPLPTKSTTKPGDTLPAIKNSTLQIPPIIGKDASMMRSRSQGAHNRSHNEKSLLQISIDSSDKKSPDKML